VPSLQLPGGYEQYRAARRNMLEAYALTFLQKRSDLRQVVGIATEPSTGRGSSEDLIMVRQMQWTPDLVQELERRKKLYDIVQEGNYTEYAVQNDEFPEANEPNESRE
jgi:hypothetical protein